MQAGNLNLSRNVNKTVCMVLNPNKRDRIIISKFPCFTVDNSSLKFVDKFKYLGHVITSNLSDDADIHLSLIHISEPTRPY